MNFSEAIGKLHEIESTHNTFEMEIDGAPIWEYIRSKLFVAIRGKHTQARGPSFGPGSEGAPRIVKAASVIKNSLRPTRNPFLMGERDVLFIGMGRRRRTHDNYYSDIIFDPLVDELRSHDISWALLEPPIWGHPKLHFRSNSTPDSKLYFEDIMIIPQHIFEGLGVKDVTISETQKHQIETIADELEQELCIDVDSWLISAIQMSLKQRYIRISLFRRLFQYVDPDILGITNRSGHLPAIEAAHELNIPVVEFQQGIINEMHTGFSYPNGVTPKTTPTHLFTWGTAWAESINAPSIQTHVTGYPFAEQEITRLHEISEGRQDRIVVFSQWFAGQRCVDFSIDLARLFFDEETEVIFKPHPKVGEQWRKYYPELQKSDVKVRTDNEAEGGGLYKLLANSTGQVGISSTTLFEGLQFELQTYVINEFSCDYMEPIICNDGAKLVSEPEEVYDDYHPDSVNSFSELSSYFHRTSGSETTNKLIHLANQV